MAEAKQGQVEIACKNCVFWDTSNPNGNEALFDPHGKHEEYACCWWPVVTYKKGDEWCAQFQSEVKGADGSDQRATRKAP
jgi:hypothetical protein